MKKTNKVLFTALILLSNAYTLGVIHGPLGGFLITAGIITGNEGRKEFLRAVQQENNIQKKVNQITKAREAITAEEWGGTGNEKQKEIIEFQEQCERFVMRYRATLAWGSLTGLFMRNGFKSLLRGLRI